MYSAFLFTLILIPLVLSSNADEPEKRQLPAGSYAPHYPYYNPFALQYGQVNPKLFFGGISTSTFTSTSVAVATCTVSTTACTTGRRRRGIAFDEDEEDIAASAPIKVEATQLTRMGELDREKREPSPQYYYVPTPFAYPSHYDINPSFEKNVARPYPYASPFTPYMMPQQALPSDQRLFFNVFVGTTITTVSTSTSTSRPACSSASGFTQC